MFIQSLKRLFFSDSTISRFQDNLTEYSEQFKDNPMIKGVLLSEINLSTSPSMIAHKLGTVPIGYIIVKKNASAIIYYIDSKTDADYITLQASASVTASIWVF